MKSPLWQPAESGVLLGGVAYLALALIWLNSKLAPLGGHGHDAHHGPGAHQQQLEAQRAGDGVCRALGFRVRRADATVARGRRRGRPAGGGAGQGW